MTWWATGVAAGASALALMLWLRPVPRRRLIRVMSPAATTGAGRLARWRRDTGLMLRLAGAAIACATAWFTLAGRAHLVVLAFVGVFVAWSALTLRARSHRATRRRRRQAAMIELCDVLAAELDAGAPPALALHHSSADWPVLGPAATAARLGGDVAHSLRTAAAEPGSEALAHLGAAWEVSTRSGAALSGTLDRLSTTLRDDQEARREVTASLGSPRATARLLAVLPVLGLVLGTGIGSDPWAVLTGSMLGAGCLAAGAVLAVTGVFWVERIADRAEVGP